MMPHNNTTAPRIFLYTPDSPVNRVIRETKLHSHAEYVYRLHRRFKKSSCSNPEAADYYFVPINLIHYQFSKTSPDPWDERCPSSRSSGSFRRAVNRGADTPAARRDFEGSAKSISPQ
jgi:hypothetical protein